MTARSSAAARRATIIHASIGGDGVMWCINRAVAPPVANGSALTQLSCDCSERDARTRLCLATRMRVSRLSVSGYYVRAERTLSIRMPFTARGIHALASGVPAARGGPLAATIGPPVPACYTCRLSLGRRAVP